MGEALSECDLSTMRKKVMCMVNRGKGGEGYWRTFCITISQCLSKAILKLVRNSSETALKSQSLQDWIN